ARLAREQFTEPRPLLLKVAPDLGGDELDASVDAAVEHRIAGIIATNTTRSREGLASSTLAEEEGGLSGEPLRERSTQMVGQIARRAGKKLEIIAVGGITTADDVREKRVAGA